MQVTNGGLSRPRQATGHMLSPLDNSPPLGGSIDGRLRGTIQSAPAPQQPPRTQHSQIAIQFVKDFYLTLASQGESVWPYYHENDSVLSRPEESQASNDNSNVTGQLPIYRTLASLGLKNSRYKINTVDSQPSVDGGVHLLVTGLVQGTASRLETPRTFAQSFHLARTKDGASYYIRNDILRIVGAVPQSPRPQPTAQPQPTPQQAQPQPQQPQQTQPQQTQTQPTATLPVQRPRAIPSTTQLNQLSVSLSNSSPSTPSLSSQPLKAKKDFYDQKDDSFDQIVISSSTTHSISQTLNNTTAIPDKIITHSPPVQVSTAVSAIPTTISQQQATTNKLKWGDREPKYEEDDEEEEDYDGKGYEYEQVKEEKWRKKTPQPQTSQAQQTSQPQQTTQPQTQPTQPQPQRSTTQPQQQSQPQSPQQSVKPVQPVQPVQQSTPVQSTKSVAPAPQRQVPVKPAGQQTQPAQQAQVQVTQQPQVQQAQIQQAQQAQQAQSTQQASKQQTAPVKQAVKTQSPPAQAQQAQSQGQQVQGQQAKSQGQQKSFKVSQPKKIDVETYAGRIGIRPDNNTYYRQPKPLKPITTEEYRPKEKEARKDGGRGRGQGGQGGQGGRGGGRGGGQAGNAEFRPRSQEPTPSLFVSGIPEDADENSVAEHFKHFGTVKGVDFPSDKNFCFVHFESQEGIDNAMATEEEIEWDGFSIWYEPKRLPAPRAPRGVGGAGSAGGAGRGGGGGGGKNTTPAGKNTTSGPKETKQDTATGKDNSGGKAQQPQKQRTHSQSQKQSQKQRTHSQSQGGQDADDQQGAWKKVEHRNNRRKQQTAEKKGDKKTEKKGERK